MTKMIMGEQPPKLQVRYGTFGTSVEKQPWRNCLEADLTEGRLAIKWDRDTLEWIPLHVIRGEIQVRKWIAPAPPASPATSETQP